MPRVCKILSFVSGCWGMALFIVALLAMPQNLTRANDPSSGGEPSAATPSTLCKLLGNPAMACNTTPYPDPCIVILEDCVNWSGSCSCQ